MSKSFKLPVNGMNNRVSIETLPQATEDIPWSKARNAVNCVFDDRGRIQFPRPGKTLKYAGDCKWVYKGPNITLFVEDGVLKKLNSDNTATTVKTGVGDSRMSYTTVENTTYWANALISGKVSSAGVASEWGVQRPSRQPDVSVLSTGGLHAGSYRVAITWIGSDGLESGAGPGARVEVPAGGGIHLTNFPVPPSYVTGVAVYVSSVNSKDFYLYGEYSASINDVVIFYKVCTIPLQTQFMFPPIPRAEIIAHYGRIYYVVGKRLYFTAPTKYGLQRKNSYWAFDSDIQVVATTPKVLFVGTQNQVVKITEIDGEGPAIFETLKDYGAVRGSVAYDPNGVSAYFMTTHGIVAVSPEGVDELNYKDVAIPFFTSGVTTITERDGVKLLTFIGQGGAQNPLADDEYNTSELARGSL